MGSYNKKTLKTLKHYVRMFSSNVCGDKNLAAEQNIREFRKLLFKTNSLDKKE